MSSRRGGFCRCDNPFEPVPTHTLHRMDPGGKHLRALSLHETNEWHPSVLNDGRIVYCRWDYVDRSAAHFHGLWVSNPDGSNPAILFGNYTKRISTCFQPRAIPGSNRIVFVAGAHHANVGGSLVIFDPTRARLDPDTGQDRFESLEILTPEVCFPETPDCWPKSYYASPWPLSEDYYLVAFSFDPLPGMGSGVKRDTETGIYYFDRFGNLELLYREPGERRGCVGCHERPGTPPPARQLLATTRPPSDICPGPDGTRPLSYPRLIQPVLQRHCVRCHDGSEGPQHSPLVLTGEPKGTFTRSYENLRPYVRWYEWGSASITQTVTRPGRGGADESPLRKILDDPTHAEHVKLPGADRRRIYVWLDGNAPFYGTYREEAQRAQLAGQAVPPPELQ